MCGQVLGENALLARVLLEGVGSFARALGMRYRRNGRLMYTVLIPVLERLADPCPSVSAAAGAAMGSLCLHSGYSSFNELVGVLSTAASFSSCPASPSHRVLALSPPMIIPTAFACTLYTCSQGRSELCMNSKMWGMQVRGNADYIVDGLCRQLRHLESHPRYGTALIRLQERDLGLGVPATGNGSSESSWLFDSGWWPESSLDPWAHHLPPVTDFLVCFNEASSICADDSIWPVLWSHACTVRRHHRQQTPALQQGTYTHSAEACVRVK